MDNVAKAKRRQHEKHHAIVNEIKNVPCVDCGILYPHYVMQFDHVRGIKDFTIGPKVGRFALQRILDEIVKCDVVCANCHATRTWLRRQGDVK